jgi:hypothetical protein
MNVFQKIMFFVNALFLIFGSFIIIMFVSDGDKIVTLILFYIGMVLAVGLMYYAFSSNPKKKAEHKPEEKHDTQSTFLKDKGKAIKPSKDPAKNVQNPTYLVIQSIWPFDLFPDTVTVQENAVSIVKKQFFSLAETETIPYDNLSGVKLYSGPLFGSLDFSRKFPPLEYELKYLPRSQALKAKETIDALMLKSQQKIKVKETLPLEEKKTIIQNAGSNEDVKAEIAV